MFLNVFNVARGQDPNAIWSFFYHFKDKNSIQFSDNFFILGQITARILGNYRTKDRFVIQKIDKFGK